jgi:hypothetical protein
MPPDGNQGIAHRTATVRSHTGIFGPTRDECCIGGNGDNSLTWGFIGVIVLAGCRNYCVHDGGAILIGHWGCGAVVQEGPPLVFLAGVLPICVWSWLLLVYAAPASPISALTVKSSAEVTGFTPHLF